MTLRSYPNTDHRGWRVEELANDVCSGGDAEDNGAKDLLPPGKQEYGVLSPAAIAPRRISFNQAHGTVTFLPVTLAVWKVVAVVYSEKNEELFEGV